VAGAVASTCRKLAMRRTRVSPFAHTVSPQLRGALECRWKDDLPVIARVGGSEYPARSPTWTVRRTRANTRGSSVPAVWLEEGRSGLTGFEGLAGASRRARKASVSGPWKSVVPSRRRHLWALFAGVLLSLSIVAPFASAQDDKAIKDARQKFRQAISLQTGGNWAAALGLFRDVAAVKNTPQVQFNIAICEENLGQLVQALGDYQLAAAQATEEGNAQVAAEVEDRLETLKERIPKILIQRGQNAGIAKISIDGLEVGSAMIGKEMPVDPGQHVVQASSRGHEPFEKKVEINEKQVAEVVIDLVDLPVDDNPYAGAGTTAGPAADEGPQKGPEEKGPNLLPFIIGGVGVASLAASGVFFILRQGAISELEDACGSEGSDCDSRHESIAERGQLYSVLAPITLGVGIAGVGAGTVLFLMGNGGSDSGKDTAGLDVSVGTRGTLAGATLSGRF
jgi:hypothetical protein